MEFVGANNVVCIYFDFINGVTEKRKGSEGASSAAKFNATPDYSWKYTYTSSKHALELYSVPGGTFCTWYCKTTLADNTPTYEARKSVSANGLIVGQSSGNNNFTAFAFRY